MSEAVRPAARDAELRAIEARAAEWFGRCELGLTPAQEKEFLRWLETDPRHGEALREMDETWNVLDGLKEIRRPEVPENTASWWTRRGHRVWRPLLAAAALVLFAWLATGPLGQGLRGVRQAATEIGGMKNVELPDGSIIHLNSDTRVRFRQTARTRDVELLRGEAHFAVAKDSRRPFVVTVGSLAVRAVGTAFNVRREAQGVEVFVTEGKVRIDDARRGELLLPATDAPEPTPAVERTEVAATVTATTEGSALLVAGQRARVPDRAAAGDGDITVTRIDTDEMQRALAWQTRQLTFDLTPLSEVVAEFNRYNSHQLVIADAELGRHTFGGSFRADNYRVFVSLLERRFGVRVERDEAKTVLYRSK